MIQRIQTLYLFLAAVALMVLFFVPIYHYQQITNALLVDAKITIQGSYVKNVSTEIYELQTFNFLRMFIAAALSLFLLFTIFQFNNRKRQVGIARILVIAQFAFVIYCFTWDLRYHVCLRVLGLFVCVCARARSRGARVRWFVRACVRACMLSDRNSRKSA